MTAQKEMFVWGGIGNRSFLVPTIIDEFDDKQQSIISINSNMTFTVVTTSGSRTHAELFAKQMRKPPTNILSASSASVQKPKTLAASNRDNANVYSQYDFFRFVAFSFRLLSDYKLTLVGPQTDHRLRL